MIKSFVGRLMDGLGILALALFFLASIGWLYNAYTTLATDANADTLNKLVLAAFCVSGFVVMVMIRSLEFIFDEQSNVNSETRQPEYPPQYQRSVE